MAVDPVCKMQVNEKNPPGGKSSYQGRDYFFCNTGCKTKFDQNPQQYLGQQKR
ncbi:MAG TPA: YHS domain-containing protein [Thermoanaerobaculia bacterium]